MYLQMKKYTLYSSMSIIKFTITSKNIFTRSKKPLIDHLIERLNFSKRLIRIILAMQIHIKMIL